MIAASCWEPTDEREYGLWGGAFSRRQRGTEIGQAFAILLARYSHRWHHDLRRALGVRYLLGDAALGNHNPKLDAVGRPSYAPRHEALPDGGYAYVHADFACRLRHLVQTVE